MSLSQKELLVVTGKGGVGRTTVTAALGHAAARAGHRVCVVELSGQHSLARRLGFAEAAYGPREATPGLWVMSLSPTACLADFGARKLRIGMLARWFFESRIMTGFIESVPGLVDVVQLGKIENMLRDPAPEDERFDLVILDAPATGHGLTLLAAARAMAEMTGVGPFHDLAALIESLLGDREATGIVIVTLPEPLPVSESIQLATAQASEGTPPDLVVANQVAARWPRSLPLHTVLTTLAPRATDTPDERRAHGLLAEVASGVLRRAEAQEEALDELSSSLTTVVGRQVPVIRLPVLEETDEIATLATSFASCFRGTP